MFVTEVRSKDLLLMATANSWLCLRCSFSDRFAILSSYIIGGKLLKSFVSDSVQSFLRTYCLIYSDICRKVFEAMAPLLQVLYTITVSHEPSTTSNVSTPPPFPLPLELEDVWQFKCFLINTQTLVTYTLFGKDIEGKRTVGDRIRGCLVDTECSEIVYCTINLSL